jgi:PAS domain S-box-containing protein
MALAVLASWHAHVGASVRIFPGLIAMHYNTALCFLALGAAGLGVSPRRHLLLFFGGGIAALMGAAVILEYAIGTSFGIDTLFCYPWERALSAEPGRMALTTAISLLLTGCSLVILAARQDSYAFFGVANSVTLSLALTSLAGYSLHVTYVLPFSLGPQMALNTSAVFFAYGIATLGYAWRYAERGSDGLPRWGAGIGTAMLPVLLVGASAVFPTRSWKVVPIELLLSTLGLAVITLAVLKLKTAKVAYKGLLMIAIPLALLLIFVGLVVRVKRQSETAQTWALHSEEVLGVSRSLIGRLTEAESAVRGYVITRDEAFVDSFATSVESVQQATAQLRRLVVDKPLQEATAARIEGLTAQRLDHLSHIIGLMKTANKTQAEEDVKRGKGSDLMRQIRAELDGFLAEEESFASERRDTLDASWQQLSWLLVAGVAGAILMASILALLFSGSLSSRLQRLRDNAVRLAAGKELAAPLTGHDEIAELDRAFHEMAESLDEVTRREKVVIEGSADSIFVKDLNHRYLMINPAGAAMIGRTVDEIIGASNEELIEADSARRIREQDNEVIATGQTTTYELISTNKAGMERVFWTTRGPYRDRHGVIIGILGISHDITERNQIAVQLEKARDAALESVRLKSEFLANMSHEIRTPMNGVIGMTGLLLETNLTSRQQGYADAIQSSAEALLIIIDDILDFSKIEAGLLRFEKIDFDLRAAVEAVADLLAEKAHAKGLELASLVHQDVPTSLRGDPGRLRQILTNLIGNAVKFTDRGEVVVTVTKVSETPSLGMLRFEIQDTGIGISAEAQGRLFHAFIQADGSTTRTYGGTGLGLAISKQLVELMGGRIGIQSTPGQGSTFWFIAEFEKQRQHSTTPSDKERETTAALSAARVLIVDDNATNRSILNHQTTSWGMIATEAESGKRALELLRAGARLGQSFDVAILDLMMPEMNGLQLAEAIKADPTIAAVTLVLLPSFAESGQDDSARQVGIAACLPKPVGQSKLYDCLVTVMARSIATEPITPAHRGATKPLTGARTPGDEILGEETLQADFQQQEQTPFSTARIIIAEDNLVNQNVALGQLYNLGYNADVVLNGLELLKALESADFDLILMDCQMPRMDGFAATAEIRRREGTARHTTIIAMTANALDGDDQRCLAAGMDDYLSKPVKAEILHEKMERWIKPPDAHHSVDRSNEDAVIPGGTRGDVIDLAQIASLREIRQPGKGDFVTHLIDLFVNETVSELKVLHDAVSSNDAAEILRVAHLLKGGSSNIGAIQMTALYEQLEATVGGANGDSKALLTRLDHEFELVREALKAERRETRTD